MVLSNASSALMKTAHPGQHAVVLCPCIYIQHNENIPKARANININVKTMRIPTSQASSLRLAIARDTRFYTCYHCNLDTVTPQSLKLCDHLQSSFLPWCFWCLESTRTLITQTNTSKERIRAATRVAPSLWALTLPLRHRLLLQPPDRL